LRWRTYRERHAGEQAAANADSRCSQHENASICFPSMSFADTDPL
jgi:hypothetical protein